MVNICSVYGCANRSKRDNVSFFRFPLIRERFGAKLRQEIATRRNKWLACIKRSDLSEHNLKFARVCSDHFHSGKPAALADIDNPDWLPSLKLGHNAIKSSEGSVKRYHRAARRSSTVQLMEEQVQNLVEIVVGAQDREEVVLVDVTRDISIPTDVEVVTAECQTDISGELLKAQQQEIQRAYAEILTLKEHVKNMTFSRESFESDDSKTKFYTGLPNFETFLFLINSLSPFLTVNGMSMLTKFQQLLLFLMKLRLNLTFQDLGYRFDVDSTTASRCFHNCLDLCYVRLKHLVKRPVIGTLRKKYTVLNGPVPVATLSKGGSGSLPTADKMLSVACALCNLPSSVVPLD